MLTTALCGAVVMVIEVLGSKVVSPFFGVSLFVWTSMIAVTLGALSLGYALGGVLADRKSDPLGLYAIILGAGVLVLLVPGLKGPVLKSCVGLGLRAGSFASALGLFFPPLLLLGCTSPYVVRLAAREASRLGRTVGLFYAVSTLGSLAGTLLAGFVLLAYFRVDRIFQFLGASLIVVAAAYFLLFRRRLAAAGCLLLPLLIQPPARTHEKVLANGTTVTEVFAQDGFYGNVKVLDYSYGEKRIRELTIDGLIQSGMDLRSGLSVYAYPYLLELLPYGTNPTGRRCLVLGLGAGIVPMWYEARGVRTDVVDIDPRIPGVAQRYFGFRAPGGVVISDARCYLRGTHERYDYIIVDVANGDWAPAHILSLETFRLMRERLSDGGIVAINLIGSLRDHPLMTASVVRTLGLVFGTVRTYASVDPEKGVDVQNVEILAYDDRAMAFDPGRVAGFPIHAMVDPAIRDVRGRELAFPGATSGMILEDGFNPVDFYDLPVKESIRRELLSYTDWDMLM
ncbi:MAG: fused MFS/spermidine synthase [Acidobacteriota bacterium]